MKFFWFFPFSFFLLQPLIAQATFEGKVTYEISYEPIHPNASADFLEENYGAKEILYYKKGHYKRIKLNRSNDTVSVVIFNPKVKIMYGRHISVRDTIMVYSSTENVMSTYTFNNVETDVIMGHEVYGVRYNFNYKQDDVRSGPETSEMTYYFSKDFSIKARWHKNQKDGFYNEIIREHPYLILKMVNDDNWIKIETKTAIDVKPMDIDKSIFKIDISKPLKEI